MTTRRRIARTLPPLAVAACVGLPVASASAVGKCQNNVCFDVWTSGDGNVVDRIAISNNGPVDFAGVQLRMLRLQNGTIVERYGLGVYSPLRKQQYVTGIPQVFADYCTKASNARGGCGTWPRSGNQLGMEFKIGYGAWQSMTSGGNTVDIKAK